MQTRRNDQMNVRSSFLRERVPQLAAETGLTVTQVLEEAVRSFTPRPQVGGHGLKQVGKFLVGRSYNHQPVTLEQANTDLDEIRSGARD